MPGSDQDYRSQLPVFPGAEGFGSTTRAGRGGRILRVTTLADSGPGSFREAATAAGPRTVIFEVGGVIRLKSQLRVREPFLTIAGQTAPSPGITLAGDKLSLETHDVLMQHLRIRAGDAVSSTNTAPDLRDGLGVRSNESGEPHVYNVFIDHCSISWAIDENVSFWFPNVYDVTLNNSIISEGLDYSLHSDGRHSMGMLVGNGQRRISVVRNLFAHNWDRNPRFAIDSTGLIVNNVIYNSRNRAIVSGGGARPHLPTLLTVVGNVYLPGTDSLPQRKTVTAMNGHADTRLFVADNIGPYSSEDPWSAVDNHVGEHIRADSPPVRVTPLTVLPAASAFERVLADAGARPADRDSVDRRIVSDVRLGQGRLIDSPSQVGGLLSMRSTRHHLQPPKNVTADTDGDGYTDLEEWLHCMAQKVERAAAAQYSCR